MRVSRIHSLGRGCLILSLLLFAAPALATTVIHVDTRELVRSSDEIVVGQVDGTRSYWNENRTKILTDVTVRVSSSLKGRYADRLTLTQLGGEVDGVRYSVPGCPVFRPGEEALLFVWRDSRGRAQVNGLAQGKFEIRRDPVSGAAFVQRAATGFAVRDARTLRAVEAGQPAPLITLDQLVSEIRRAMVEDGR
jgi:hypothetical protein